MPGLESLIRLTVIGLLATVALPKFQVHMQTQTQRAIDQMLQAQDLSFPIDGVHVPTYGQAPLPTVHVSQALYARLVSASSP